MRTDEQVNAFLINAADRMRFTPTAAEAVLSGALKALGFKLQYPIQVPNRKYPKRSYPYVLDAFHERAQLCVEIDGGVHSRQRGRDRRRDERLRMAGIRTIRITNKQVLNDFNRTLDGIEKALGSSGEQAPTRKFNFDL